MHNRYRSDAPSGENRVVDAEVTALRERGVEVSTVLLSSDELGGVTRLTSAGLAAVSLGPAPRKFEKFLDRYRPDILHVHNFIPSIPPAVVASAKERGIPVVKTLHNARYFCMKSTMQRDGQMCFDCRERASPLPGVVHGCYRESRIQSAVMAAALSRARPHYAAIDRHLAVSRFLADHLIQAGLEATKVHVRPNGVADPGPPPSAHGPDVLFVGRLDHGKGVLDLLVAWEALEEMTDRRLIVVGAGPLEHEVRARARRLGNVDVVGFVSPDDLPQMRERAAVAVMPSLVPESFGLAAIEAFASGIPVIARRIGALPELVDDDVGWLFDSGQDLVDILRSLTASELAARGHAARQRFMERYSLEHAVDELLRHYRELRSR